MAWEAVMARSMVIGLAAALLASPALAQSEPDYRDDRSSPAALVGSLYNAIARKEYARAWSYFAEPPADSLEAYAAGYADTASVEIRTGTAFEEGAAGSLYYLLPVAISAERPDGSYAQFAGCYTIRLLQPAVQDAPFRPMAIEGADLEATDLPFEEALPTQCGEQQLPANDAVRARADEVFAAAYDQYCMRDAFMVDAAAEPDEFSITFRPSWSGEDGSDETFRLFRYFCSRGAYNEAHVYLMAGYDGEVEFVSFAVPDMDIRYVGDGDTEIESMELLGYGTRIRMTNSEFDPDTRELMANAKWRGLGDASESGLWVFRDGGFQLVRYEIDPTYDGEINPQTVVEVGETP
jgi:hypothetical protein